MSKRLICTNKICRWMTTEEESEDRVFNTGNCAKCNSPLEPYTTPTSNTSDELLKQIETKLRDYRFFGLVDEDGNDIEARLGDICEPEDLAKDISNIIEAHCNKASRQVAVNAMAIAEYWLEEDGRPKHLIQDLWDVQDISVLDHIEQTYIDRAEAQLKQGGSK